MISERTNGSDRRDSTEIDALLQVAIELEGLCKLADVVPEPVLWDRPPGLPSGVELLWLIHLVDRHVFLPAAKAVQAGNQPRTDSPDYQRLLTADPCTVESLEDLYDYVSGSRRKIVEQIKEPLSTSTRSLIEIILTHDRQILAAFTERLYESGLGI